MCRQMAHSIIIQAVPIHVLPGPYVPPIVEHDVAVPFFGTYITLAVIDSLFGLWGGDVLRKSSMVEEIAIIHYTKKWSHMPQGLVEPAIFYPDTAKLHYLFCR